MTAAFSRRWWSHAHHYEWMSDYLAARRMTGAVRLMMGGIAASLALCLVILLRYDGPQHTVPVAMTWAAFGGGVVGVVMWLRRWPTHTESVVFAVVSNAAIALSCLAYPNPTERCSGASRSRPSPPTSRSSTRRRWCSTTSR
ncbi:hypothetical protein [Mycobacterium sp. IS-1742]|uniref:hypothetical protein n=1 Tax=Mycobacterium sp. IS-1742 TaxID=1772285 RepID=UPI001E4C5637|nr:hypothetical protein [Mycobacterium sp. IS-1742]